MKTICLDPGHGLANRRPGVYDPGATVTRGTLTITEAGVVMAWADELRAHLMARGLHVVRTRVDDSDPCPVGGRARIARHYQADVMISLHCNAADARASGTETFFRGKENAPLAARLNDAVRLALGTKDRGIKTEAQSQHQTLAVMSFQPCFLIELGFLDHDSDREKMTDPVLRTKACEALADVLSE